MEYKIPFRYSVLVFPLQYFHAQQTYANNAKQGLSVVVTICDPTLSFSSFKQILQLQLYMLTILKFIIWMVNLSYFINKCNGILYSSLFVCKYLCPALFVLLVLGPVSVGGLFKKLASPLWTHIHWYEMKTQSLQFLKTFFSKLTSCTLAQEQVLKLEYRNN